MNSPNNSSYSDPFYDRLDAFFAWLGRRWLVFVIALTIAVIGALVIRSNLSHNPNAISAAALQKARSAGNESLIAFIDNEGQTPESRARAALDIVSLRASEEAFAQAEELAHKAITLAEQGSQENLVSASRMSLAAVLEQSGKLTEARDLYQTVTSDAAGVYPAYALSSEIAAALLDATIADQEENAAQAADLRLNALRTLSGYAGQSRSDGSIAITAAATWRYYDLRRAHPELAQKLDEELGVTVADGE